MNTKAQTLYYLNKKLKKSKICKLLFFKILEWEKSKKIILENIKKTFLGERVIIRSSAIGEDGKFSSLAGAFDSIKNVNIKDEKSLIRAIEKVINSYGENHSRNNEILVQAMLNDVSVSGVIFTHELNFGSPYYVINYDDISGATDTVTAGEGLYSNRTLYVHRNALNKIRSKRFIMLISAVKEVEKVMRSEFLDIEFAINDKLDIFILQVRAITTQINWNRSIVNNINNSLNGIQNLIKNKFKKINGIYGETTVFGQMPDWNPVEMIGRAPRELAFSLYQKIITNHAWRIARKTMNYSVPEGQPLMLSLAGQPYIDTRLSFHSYLPSSLNSSISNKLVNHWVRALKEDPKLHDKIEFNIAITTYSFDIDLKINKLIGDILNSKEKEIFKDTFLQHTLDILDEENKGSINNALLKIESLKSLQDDYPIKGDLSQVPRLIDDCINLGTIPFSILARHGFIAKTLLLSLVQKNIISEEDKNNFLFSVKTIASYLVEDMERLESGKLELSEFMEKYGHLRPGTYDIMSMRYDKIKDFKKIKFQTLQKKHEFKFDLNDSQKKHIDMLLKEQKFLNFNHERLLTYIRQAIAGREYGKFIFTKSLSDILEIIADYGECHYLSRDELSNIPINRFLGLLKGSLSTDVEGYLRSISKINKEKNHVTSAIRLPQVLFDTAGVFVIPFQVSQPNFITNKKIIEKSISLTTNDIDYDLKDKIVLIENADPGYDWIFTQKISGLITKYGGANSHMAIRCAEFSLPAAIGCGEQRYNILLKANRIMLDCSGSLIKSVG